MNSQSYTHHITIVGKELMPLIIGFFAEPAENVVIVHSKDSLNHALAFERFVKNRDAKDVRLLEVEPFDLKEIYWKAEQSAVSLSGQRVILNYTGGTKQMSIGFFSAALTYGFHGMYVDSQHSKVQLQRNNEWVESGFPEVNISVKEWLSLNLKELKMRSKDITSIEDLTPLTDWLFFQRKKYSQELYAITSYAQKLLTQKEKNKVGPSKLIWGKSFIFSPLRITPENNNTTLQVIFEGHVLKEREPEWWICFFSSNWFEFWIYRQLVATGAYDDVLMNVEIINAPDSSNPSVVNEIDVLAIRNGYLTIIDAKLGQPDQKSITKLLADRNSYASKYSQMYFVSFASPKDLVHQQRINSLGIVPISGNLEKKLSSLHLSREGSPNL